jgi:hypothetical protein
MHQKNMRNSNVNMPCIIGRIPGSAKLKLQLELNVMWGISLYYCYLSFCITTCIILRIAQLCIDLRIFFLYVLFGSSRVDIDTEQFEKEFLYVTPEDRVRAFSSDLTGEPTPSPILHFHALLIYCYPYIAILLCHVSYSTCCPILPNYTSSPYPLFVVCQLCES